MSGAHCWNQALRSSSTSTSRAPWPLRPRARLQVLELGSALCPWRLAAQAVFSSSSLQGKWEALHAMWQVTRGLGPSDWSGQDAGPPETPTRRLSELPPTPLGAAGWRGAWSLGQGAELCPDPSGRQTPPQGWACRRLASQDLSGSYWRSRRPNQVCVTSSSHKPRDEALLRSHCSQAGRRDRRGLEERPSASSPAAGRPQALRAGETSAQTPRGPPRRVALWLPPQRTTGGWIHSLPGPLIKVSAGPRPPPPPGGPRGGSFWPLPAPGGFRRPTRTKSRAQLQEPEPLGRVPAVSACLHLYVASLPLRSDVRLAPRSRALVTTSGSSITQVSLPP